MYKEGDILKIRTPEAPDGLKYLMFTEDAHSVNDNPLKYMAPARPICDDYYMRKDSEESKVYCKGCRFNCPAHPYMIKYVGNFEGKSVPAKRVSVRQKQDATMNNELDELIRQKKEAAQKEKRAEESDLERERKLLANQASVRIVSPFLMQTILEGHDKCGDTDVDYVVLEYVKGVELGKCITLLKNMEDQKEADRRRLDLIRQLLYAVRAYAKQYSAVYNVHRDLKPANILVYSYDEVNAFQQLKLIDFDMMVEQNNIRFYDLYMGGTVGYVHPEAYRWKDLPNESERQFSHRWDLYAVGLIMYEIMEGKPHFIVEGEDKIDESYLDDPDKAYTLKPLSRRKLWPGAEAVRNGIEPVIRKLISNSKDHYEDIDEVIDDYQCFLEMNNRNWYADYYLDHWLDCRPGYDRQLPFVNAYCRVMSDGLKDCRQSFCVSNNTVIKLTYGENIIGCANVTGRTAEGERPVQKIIGAFYYISGILRFMPLSSQCFVTGSSGNEPDEIDEGMEISYQDVKIQIEKIEYYD